ncbi:MAG TPA: tetratricopeptide repeat protein [Terriglobia bacterium]|nr:tetratricopeptide repeat protein [Terriglobia bacterium]
MTINPGRQKKRQQWSSRSHLIHIFVLTLIVPSVSGQGLAQSSSPAGHVQESRRNNPASDENARLSEQAQEALQHGDYPKAIEYLERLVASAPGISEIHANLASAYYAVGRFRDATGQAREALKLKPSLTNAHFILGLSLAEGGRCEEALPQLSKDYLRAPDPTMKRMIGTDALRCDLYLNETDKAIELLRSLNRDFPNDPDVLYLSSHVYSDLSTQTSQRLLATAPGSYQAHQLNAEFLELQGKLAEAAEEYRKVLSLRPDLAGIHYQLGELLLAGGPGANTIDQARQEFEKELEIDPRSAPAEYELGEIARQGRQWGQAIDHFGRAASFEPRFTDALIGLGKTLVSAGRPQDAVAPLERAVNLDRDNPNAHYQLSFAYRRLGRDQDAAKELAAYRESHDKLQNTNLRIRSGMTGNIAQPQKDTPPE